VQRSQNTIQTWNKGVLVIQTEYDRQRLADCPAAIDETEVSGIEAFMTVVTHHEVGTRWHGQRAEALLDAGPTQCDEMAVTGDVLFDLLTVVFGPGNSIPGRMTTDHQHIATERNPIPGKAMTRLT